MLGEAPISMRFFRIGPLKSAEEFETDLIRGTFDEPKAIYFFLLDFPATLKAIATACF